MKQISNPTAFFITLAVIAIFAIASFKTIGQAALYSIIAGACMILLLQFVNCLKAFEWLKSTTSFIWLLLAVLCAVLPFTPLGVEANGLHIGINLWGFIVPIGVFSKYFYLLFIALFLSQNNSLNWIILSTAFVYTLILLFINLITGDICSAIITGASFTLILIFNAVRNKKINNPCAINFCIGVAVITLAQLIAMAIGYSIFRADLIITLTSLGVVLSIAKYC